MVMGTTKMKPTLLQRPYSERQKIVITTDLIAAAMREAETKASETEENLDLADIALRILFPAGYLVKSAVEAAAEEIKTWTRAKDNEVPILYVGETEASELIFPPGHPRKNTLYIGHPAKPQVYYTIADFHRLTFEHKFSEAINLLMHLGATYIRVEHIRGWSKEFSSRLSAALGEAPTRIDAEAKEARSSDTQLMYEATLLGTKEARLPESLVWYSHEPTWQSVAKGRIEFGLQEFALNVTYEDDYGVNAGLKASAFKAGFDLGGKFADHKATTWRIAGRFRTPH